MIIAMKAKRWGKRQLLFFLAALPVMSIISSLFPFYSSIASAECVASSSYSISTDDSTITEKRVSCVTNAKTKSVTQQNITINYNRLDKSAWNFMNSSVSSGDYQVGCYVIVLSQPTAASTTGTKYTVGLGSTKGSTNCVYSDQKTDQSSVTVDTSVSDSYISSLSASSAETDPLVKLLCGAAPSTDNAYSVWTDCQKDVIAAYDKCNTTGGSATSATADTPDNVAKCIVKNKPWQGNTHGMQSSTADKIAEAITNGRSDRDAATTEAANKALCDAKTDGSTWDSTNKTCVAPDSTTESQTASCKSAADATFGFGWLLCPGYSLVTGAVDLLVGWISTGLMQWTLLSGSSAGDIKNAWSSMLTIANIAFAIVFLIVIYSTATSTGLTNYSVKKILPRLVLVAIGVNVSFYIAAALADLSNIAAIGIKGSIFSMLNLGDNDVLTAIGNVESSRWQTIGLIVLMVVAWSSVLLGLVIILAALVFRSVVLTVLVIISPLAFVAALLPNTEKWWKKWLDEYIRLLVIYPAFMLVWAGSRFVANISANTGDAATLTASKAYTDTTATQTLTSA